MKAVARGGWLVFALALNASGQGIHGGLKLGIPFTRYFETGAEGTRNGTTAYSAATRRYTFGIFGEWRFTSRAGVEIDALFHRMGYVAIVNFVSSASGSFDYSAIDVKGDSWDFPFLVKYHFGRAVRPYVLGGPVLRYMGPVRGKGQQTVGSLATGASTTTPIDTTDPSELSQRFYAGLAVGAGLELGSRRLRLLPEIRYTRWTANIGGPVSLLRFAPNQVEFLLGALL